MVDTLIRVAIGGLVVTLFSMLGDVFRPKSFAGLFGAAPSIALATLGLTVAHNGKAYAAIEARSMMFGALAFCVYAALVSWIVMRWRPSALKTTIAVMPLWFGFSAAAWVLLRAPR